MTPLLLLIAAAWSGDMRIIERVDPITDERSAYAVVGSQDIYLAIGCDGTNSSKLRVAAQFDRYLGDATPGLLMGGLDVLYRFDKSAAQSARWSSLGRLASAEGAPSRPMRFALEMKGTRALHIRAFDYAGDPVEMSFTYSDPTGRIDEVLVKCGFHPDGSSPKGRRKRSAAR